MRNLILIPILLVFAVSCSAQEDPPACLTIDGGGSHHFGDITHTDRPSHRFVLRNVCSDTVRITHVKAACGCTAAALSGGTVPPGGTASVDVTFYPPRTTNGHISKSVAVWVDGGTQEQYVLRVEADIRSYFQTDPEKVDLGILTRGAAREAVVRLTNDSQDTQEITDILPALSIEHRGKDGNAPPQVVPLEDVTFEPRQFTLAPGASQDITVRLTPDRTGTLLGAMVIYTAPETRQVEFSGKITGE